MRLLLVEDDNMLGESLKKALEQHAYGVDWVQDGESAIDMLKDSPFVAVVLDVNLPKYSGIEVLKHMRARKKCCTGKRGVRLQSIITFFVRALAMTAL